MCKTARGRGKRTWAAVVAFYGYPSFVFVIQTKKVFISQRITNGMV
jgi:hypothetical protein